MLNLDSEFKQKLLMQIDQEYNEWSEYVDPKRQQYKRRIEKRNKQQKDETKININMIANAIDTLIATSYTDGLTVNFNAKDGWIGQEKADNLNFIAEFDNNEDDYQQLYYQKEQDRYFFWVSLRYRDAWDDARKLPTFSVINPLTWIPDPLPTQSGRFDGKGYRYHWFEMQTSINDLLADKTYDRDALDERCFNYFSEKNRELRGAYAAAYNYNMPLGCADLKTNHSLDVYHHFTHVNVDGQVKKYHITLTNDRRHIIRMLELKPVLDEEKKDRSLIDFPIVLNYRKPRRNDPFGESVCDKLEDKQTAKTILFNLNIIKAKKEALGGDFVWNSRLIKNKNDILKPTTNGRNIFVDTNEPLSNVGFELPRSQIKADSLNMMTMLDNESALDVNLDNQQQGILTDRNVTATESQIVQANANIIWLLNNKINSRWDKAFWFQRWKGYQENFASADKKLLVIKSNFEYKSLALTKDEFLSKQVPFITVWTKADVEGQRQKEVMYRDKAIAMILQDTETPPASKNFAKRMRYRANWKTPNEINVLCPLTQYERKAYNYVSMVNMDVVPESIFNSPTDALRTYRVYIQKANETPAKAKVLETLQQALENVPMGGQVNEAFSEMANSSNNIAMSQAIQSKQPQQWRQALIPQS